MNFAAHDGLFATGLDPSAYDLPHPPIDFRVILLVRKVFVEAFALLRARCAEKQTPLAAWREDDITIALHAIIENDFRQKGRAVSGFNRRTFETVYRQTRVVNYSLTLVAKEPDMLFRMRGEEEPARVLSSQNALFVECKPVDATHPAGTDYCDAGLHRFVRGDYAWAMQEALMVAYVRGNRTIAKNLTKAIAERPELCAVPPLATHATHAPADAVTEALHASTHKRPFPWAGAKGPACPIKVYHSWHQAN